MALQGRILRIISPELDREGLGGNYAYLYPVSVSTVDGYGKDADDDWADGQYTFEERIADQVEAEIQEELKHEELIPVADKRPYLYSAVASAVGTELRHIGGQVVPLKPIYKTNQADKPWYVLIVWQEPEELPYVELCRVLLVRPPAHGRTTPYDDIRISIKKTLHPV